jgi:CheY-like chemotaxis protein
MSERFQLLGRRVRGNIAPNFNVRILVVDDDQVNLLVATNYLRSFNKYCFDTANNGQEAIELIKMKSLSGLFYDIVLMDCNMPVMDGFEATNILTNMMEKGKIPKLLVIACTANASSKDFEKCYKSGMIDFIVKPFTKYELDLKLKKHLKIGI